MLEIVKPFEFEGPVIVTFQTLSKCGQIIQKVLSETGVSELVWQSSGRWSVGTCKLKFWWGQLVALDCWKRGYCILFSVLCCNPCLVFHRQRYGRKKRVKLIWTERGTISNFAWRCRLSFIYFYVRSSVCTIWCTCKSTTRGCSCLQNYNKEGGWYVLFWNVTASHFIAQCWVWLWLLYFLKIFLGIWKLLWPSMVCSVRNSNLLGYLQWQYII